MTTSFPGGLDSFSTRAAGETITSAETNNQSDAIEAIEGVLVGPVFYNVKAYGAVGDGVTDDTAEIQAAITAASSAGGGSVFFPPGVYIGNVTLAAGVYLVGSTPGFGYLAGGGPAQSTLKSAAGGSIVIDTPTGSTLNCGVVGLNVQGLGAATACVGIRFRNVSWGAVRQVHLFSFADEAILQNAGIACTFEDILAIGSLLDRTRSARAGVVDLAGSDHFLNRVEGTASTNDLGTITDSNLYVCGVVLRASNCMATSVIGEFSDIGIVDAGSYNRWSLCRADLNYAHGWYMASGAMLSSCMAHRNSQDTNNTYSGFYFPVSVSQANTLVGCNSGGLSGDAKKQKYGYEDLAAYASTLSRNTYTGCVGSNNGTSIYSVASSQGSAPQVPSHPLLGTNADATPSVAGTNFLLLYPYTSATTITNFNDGVNGQDLYLLGDSSVTIANNATIVTSTGANKTLADGLLYHLKLFNGVWAELA
jgi:hypothetical protein